MIARPHIGRHERRDGRASEPSPRRYDFERDVAAACDGKPLAVESSAFRDAWVKADADAKEAERARVAAEAKEAERERKLILEQEAREAEEAHKKAEQEEVQEQQEKAEQIFRGRIM